jgi:hypothetical protein
MKLLVAGLVGVMVSAALSMGCGPGLSHRVKAPEPTSDVFSAMDAELAHAMIGTTTLTSGDALPMPESRLSVAESNREPVVAAAPTWGAGGESTSEPAGAGVAPAAEAPAPANSFDMHPYDKPAPASFDMHPYD